MERSLKTSTVIRRYLGLAALALLLQACRLSGGPIDGQVLEERTDRPIPDAFVIARWTCQAGQDSGMVCYHVLVTATDKEGRYHFPEWSKEGKNYCVANQYVYLSAYKPGYAESYVSSEKKETRHLKQFTGTKEERLKSIGQGGDLRCGSPEEYRPVAEPLLRATYEEAKSIATTGKDLEILDDYLTAWEEMKFGSKTAHQRREQRRLERLKEKK